MEHEARSTEHGRGTSFPLRAPRTPLPAWRPARLPAPCSVLPANMPDTVISVENISKQYRLGEVGTGTISHDLNRWWHKLRGKEDPYLKIGQTNDRTIKGTSEYVWALQDVNFAVKRGEVLGIIGRNGAGKSTLLKILSRVTTPTTGEIKIKGRIASLLEVGTGFNPEMTGRDNIYLNGAILGMRKREIDRKFDEIVDFSGVERYIDTPVKRYSSGMYVRLAFAVAAHLEPEILIVDEVLAVGDAEFQKKCLGKMKDVAGHGRTILFVSHNMGAVRTLCNSGILLKNGALAFAGSIDTVTSAYLEAGVERSPSHTIFLAKPTGRTAIWMESVSILCNGMPSSFLETGDKLSLAIKFRSNDPIEKPIIGYLIRSSRGENAVNANNYFLKSSQYQKAVMEGMIICELGDLPLMSGSYSVSFWLCRNPHEQHHVEDVLHFTVQEKDIWGTGIFPTKELSCLWWPTEFKFLIN